MIIRKEKQKETRTLQKRKKIKIFVFLKQSKEDKKTNRKTIYKN